MSQRLLWYAILFSVTLALFGCTESATNPVDDDDPELITTIEATLRPIDGGDAIIATWEDLDGVGGNPPNRIDTIRIQADTVYTMTLRVLNRAEDPEEDVTVEIAEESTQHQFFFSFTNTQSSIAYADMDDNQLPIGIATLLSSGATADGSMTIELSHYDDPADKDGTTPSNETDISVSFPFFVQ